MKYSIGELESITKRAARGAGFEWGYAEEAGKLTRWFALRQKSGIKLLANYLNEHFRQPRKFVVPVIRDDSFAQPSEMHTFTNSAGAICPLKMGAYLSDKSADGLKMSCIIKRIAYPLLLVPYLFERAHERHEYCQISWKGVNIFNYNGQLLEGAPNQEINFEQYQLIEDSPQVNHSSNSELYAPYAEELFIQPLQNADSYDYAYQNQKQDNYAYPGSEDITSATWKSLEQLARRTYVPESETSRRAAGPGT